MDEVPAGAIPRSLRATLGNLRPSIREQEFVFLSLSPEVLEATGPWQPFAQLREDEGMTLIVTLEEARSKGLGGMPVFRCITLGVHSSLEQVGLTAVVATVLARRGIAANFLAGYHHDHVMVPADRGHEALELLRELAADPSCYALARPAPGSGRRREE